jgi:hypothetical protein
VREKFRDDLNSHIGTSAYRRIGRLYYTDGMKYLAREAESEWLLNMLRSYVPKIMEKMRQEGLAKHTATLSVEETKGTFRLFDRWLPDPEVVWGGSPDVAPYQSQHIPYTDFPLKQIKVVIGPKADKPVIESVEKVGGIIASLPTES